MEMSAAASGNGKPHHACALTGSAICYCPAGSSSIEQNLAANATKVQSNQQDNAGCFAELFNKWNDPGTAAELTAPRMYQQPSGGSAQQSAMQDVRGTGQQHREIPDSYSQRMGAQQGQQQQQQAPLKKQTQHMQRQEPAFQAQRQQDNQAHHDSKESAGTRESGRPKRAAAANRPSVAHLLDEEDTDDDDDDDGGGGRHKAGARGKPKKKDAKEKGSSYGAPSSSSLSAAPAPKPKTVARTSSKPILLTRGDLNRDLTGRTLQLLWPDDQSWWEGQVLSMDGHKAMIYYEQTGDEEEADLLELVDAKEVAWKDGSGPTGEKAGKVGAPAAREPVKSTNKRPGGDAQERPSKKQVNSDDSPSASNPGSHHQDTSAFYNSANNVPPQQQNHQQQNQQPHNSQQQPGSGQDGVGYMYPYGVAGVGSQKGAVGGAGAPSGGGGGQQQMSAQEATMRQMQQAQAMHQYQMQQQIQQQQMMARAAQQQQVQQRGGGGGGGNSGGGGGGSGSEGNSVAQLLGYGQQAIGRSVMVYYQDEDVWFTGRITRATATSLHVDYNDGASDDLVAAARVRVKIL